MYLELFHTSSDLYFQEFSLIKEIFAITLTHHRYPAQIRQLNILVCKSGILLQFFFLSQTRKHISQSLYILKLSQTQTIDDLIPNKCDVAAAQLLADQKRAMGLRFGKFVSYCLD